MASPTRIQEKSRIAKKFIGSADFDKNGDIVTNWVGRKPTVDKKGFPAYKGLPYPVNMGLTVVDTTP